MPNVEVGGPKVPIRVIEEGVVKEGDHFELGLRAQPDGKLLVDVTYPLGGRGPAGPPAVVQLGEVSEGPAGAEVHPAPDNTYVLDLDIPRGRDGEDGSDGDNGAPAKLTLATPVEGPVTDTTLEALAGNTYRLRLSLPRGPKGDAVKGDPGASIKGDKGDKGDPATLTLATAVEGALADSTLETLSGNAYRLRLSIPKGAKGDTGPPPDLGMPAAFAIATGAPGPAIQLSASRHALASVAAALSGAAVALTAAVEIQIHPAQTAEPAANSTGWKRVMRFGIGLNIAGILADADSGFLPVPAGSWLRVNVARTGIGGALALTGQRSLL